MNISYAKERHTKRSTRYRLWRRTYEVLSAIEEFAHKPVKDIIDLGTADGKMLNTIYQKYPQTRCVGVEYNEELADFGKAKFPGIEIVQGNMQSLSFPDSSFDIAIATAVIEHVPSPSKAVAEARRVLRQGGIFVLTSPDPFWERLATMVGHLKEGQHNEVMNLRRLRDLALQSGFSILKAQKFMVSPVGMPLEFAFENLLRRLRLNSIMANQLLVARC